MNSIRLQKLSPSTRLIGSGSLETISVIRRLIFFALVSSRYLVLTGLPNNLTDPVANFLC